MSEAATKPHAFKNGSRTFLTQVGIFSTKQNGLKYIFFLHKSQGHLFEN